MDNLNDVNLSGLNLWLGDCLDRMKEIPDGSVDLILTDPPYGTTACKWDSVIPFEPMWAELKRIIKPNGAIVLFGSEPFSSALRMSNIKQYKYDWVWVKNISTNFLHAKRQPLRNTETFMCFTKNVVNTTQLNLLDTHPHKAQKGVVMVFCIMGKTLEIILVEKQHVTQKQRLNLM